MAEQQAGAPPKKYSYRDFVDAWKTEYPGEFDDFDNADLADAIFAEVPEFRNLVDESTRGTESVPPPNLGGYELGPKLPSLPRTKDIAPDTRPLRPSNLGDMAVEAGLVAVPSLLGASIGSSVPGPGTAIGAVAGGAFGEALREGYQNWSGTRNDGLSLPNIAVQGAINAVPVAKYAGKGISAVAPTLAERVAPSVARMAGSTLEGAVSSAASTTAEAMIRDQRLPDLSEVGMSAALGAPFGAAFGLGHEIVNQVRLKGVTPTPEQVAQLFTDLHNAPDMTSRNAAAQAIYDVATAIGQYDSPAGAKMLQDLVSASEVISQQDLQQFAATFVQDFGRRADTLTMDGQLSEVEGFLEGLKQRGADAHVLGKTREILTTIRETSAPRPVDQPSEAGWVVPLDPAYGPKGPSEFSPQNMVPIEPNMGPVTDPGQTRPERAFGESFEQAMGERPIERNQPPMYDPTPGPGYTAREVLPRQRQLPNTETMNLAPGPDVGTPPAMIDRGVDALEGVRQGVVGRDDAMFMSWIAGDLTEAQFQPGERIRGQAGLDIMEGAESQEAGRRATYTPRAAGTPVYDAIWRLAGHTEKGQSGSRTVMATQIQNMLSGRARRPGKYALAAQKLAQLYRAAWVPERGRFDWSQVSDKELAAAGWRGTRAELMRLTPTTPLGFHVEGQPHDLLQRYGVRTAEDLTPLEQAADANPDALNEAQQIVRSASDADLKRLYDELLTYKADVPDLEEPEDFGGAWYDVGPGLIGAELERRGLGRYTQPELPTEGPGTPGKLGLRSGQTQAPADSAGGGTTRPDVGALPAGVQQGLRDLGYSEDAIREMPYGDAERLIAAGQRERRAAEQPRATTSREHMMQVLGDQEAVRGGRALERRMRDRGLVATGRDPNRAPRLEEQPELVEGVRDVERKTPLLMPEEELFSLTAEPAEPLTARRQRMQAPSLFGDETGAAGNVRGSKEKRQAALRDVKISAEHMQDLADTVRAAGNEEVAGLLVGDPDGNIRRVILSDNRAANPEKQFEIGADVIQRAQVFARERGWELLGSFHSQPTGSAEPSKRDLKGNVADLPMLIIGARGGSVRDIKIWQPSGSRSAPWLEGTVTTADAPVVPGTMAPPSVASWAVDRIPAFKGAPGDTPAMQDFLTTHKAEFSTEPWYVRAQQFVDEGNPRLAWLEVQAATLATQKGVRSLAQATPTSDAHRAALLARVEQATAAGPQDPVGALFALYDGRTTWVDGVGRVVVAPEIPPPLRGKGVSAGPGGILHPGAADIPLPSEQQVVSMTVGALNDVLKDVDAHKILDDPSQASFTRLNRQIAEQLLLRSPSSWGALKAWRTQMKARGISDRELNRQIAAHLTKTASESGRFLAALSVWKQRHQVEIRAIEGIKGASGDIEDVMLIGSGGRRIGRLGDLADADTFKDIVQPTRAWDRALLLNDLTRSERGTFDLFEASSRAFMLSQWATAARNFWSINARWGVEMFDEVASAVASTTLGKPGRALNHIRKAGDLLKYTPILRPDGWVMPWHARQAQWEQIFDSSAYLASLPAGKERRAALKLLEGVPEEAAHFLGATNFGEPTPHSVSKYRILNAISQPKVQNTLTMFNRAQEFTARSGMYVANLKDQLRLKGLDPDLIWQLPPADLAAKLGGPEEMQRVLQHSVAGALDFTFSGELIKKGFGKDEFGRPKGALNAAFVDLINKFSGIRAGYPWPRFNLSAAPRFIWDHSGVNAVVEGVNQALLEHTGVGVQRGRFYLGRKAATYEQGSIPEAQQKFREAQADLGDQLQKVQALSREHTIQKRLIARAEKRGLLQQAAAGRAQFETLDKALEREMAQFERIEGRMKGLTSQISTLQEVVDQSKAARAPETYSELFGRAGVGVAALLTPAILLRAEQQDKGTKWYELRYDIPGLGDTVIDTRPLAPFTQYLFFADVINDLDANTDWAGVHDDLAQGMQMSEAVYGRYEGKYTAKTLGQQALNAFLSMSQAAGTTLAVVEEFTALGERGLDTQRLGAAVITSIGNLLARFTIPFAQFKGLTDLVSDDESNARITSTDQGITAPLAQPLGNLPFIGAATIPETYNQLTGQPLDAYLPGIRASLGVTMRQWNRVAGEINDTGVPGSAVYIRATHDPFLDRLIGYHYAQAVSQYADPLIFANEYYQTLDSPATKRDYLQSTVFPTLKKIAIGQAMIDVGWKRIAEQRESPEQRRRRLRWERLNGLAGEEGISFAEGDASDAEPQEPDATEPEPDSQLAPPPPGTAGTAPQFQGASRGLSAPQFEEEPEDRRPAFDRALSPRAPQYVG